MSTIVVFGGGGFLGRRLVDRLSADAQYASPCGIQGAQFALQSIGFDRVKVVPADVRDRASVAAALAGTDVVINGSRPMSNRVG